MPPTESQKTEPVTVVPVPPVSVPPVDVPPANVSPESVPPITAQPPVNVPPVSSVHSQPTPPTAASVTQVTQNTLAGSKPNTPKKSGSSPLKYVAPLLLLLFLAVAGGVGLFLTQRQQNIQNQASAVTTKGQVETLSCGQITGWACDSANYSQPLKIAVYYDEFKESNLVVVADANVNRSSIADQCGGTAAHGFSIDIPSDKVPAGNHTLIVKAIPLGANGQLNSADMVTLPNPQRADVQCGAISETCSVTFVAEAAPENAITCTKESYSDELSNSAGSYSYTTKKTVFEPGEVVVFSVMLKNTGQQVQQMNMTDVLSANNLDKLDYMDTNCGTYNAQTRTLTWATDPVSAGDSVYCGFRARVQSNITEALVITNTANVTTPGGLTATCAAPITLSIPSASPSPSPSVSPSVSPSPSPSPTPSVTPTPSPSPTPVASPTPQPTPSPEVPICGSYCNPDNYVCPNYHSCDNNKCVLNACMNDVSCTADNCRATACGSSCNSNADCPMDHTCNSGVCKLTVCLEGTACDSSQCRVVAPSGTPITIAAQPSPAVSCNQACNSNADCSDGSHICVDTAEGRRCRLDSNVSSTTCSPAGEAPVAPVTPPSLPVAGSNDILKALGVGAIAVILGMVGLILL